MNINRCSRFSGCWSERWSRPFDARATMENFKIETRNNVEPERKKTATEFSYILQRQVKKRKEKSCFLIASYPLSLSHSLRIDNGWKTICEAANRNKSVWLNNWTCNVCFAVSRFGIWWARFQTHSLRYTFARTLAYSTFLGCSVLVENVASSEWLIMMAWFMLDVSYRPTLCLTADRDCNSFVHLLAPTAASKCFRPFMIRLKSFCMNEHKWKPPYAI